MVQAAIYRIRKLSNSHDDVALLCVDVLGVETQLLLACEWRPVTEAKPQQLEPRYALNTESVGVTLA